MEPPYLANQLNTQSRNLVNHPTPKPPPRNSQNRDTQTSTANPLAILPTLTFTNTENPLPYCTTVHRCLGCCINRGFLTVNFDLFHWSSVFDHCKFSAYVRKIIIFSVCGALDFSQFNDNFFSFTQIRLKLLLLLFEGD